MAAIDPLTAGGVLLATALTDADYVKFTSAVVARKRVPAATWRSIFPPPPPGGPAGGRRAGITHQQGQADAEAALRRHTKPKPKFIQPGIRLKG